MPRDKKTAPQQSESPSDLYQQAMGLFHQRQLAAAKALFERVAEGPASQMASAARLYARMCDTRLEQQGPQAKTAEDHYNLAIARINQRRLNEAESHLVTAVQLDSKGDHFYYGLAAVSALRGDPVRAAEFLRKSIELRPENRIAAVNDSDFANVAQQSPLRQLLHPEED